MNKLIFNALIIVSFFLFACKEQKTKNKIDAQNLITINNPVKISLEDFFINIDTIRLEANDESIMSSVLQMHIMNNKFYILTNNFMVVNIFNSEGKHISKIDDRGQGPTEYVRITSFEVDEINKRIILADSFSRRIFIYDEEGNQTSVINLAFEPIVILPHKSGFVNIYSGPRNIYIKPEMENYNIHFLDTDGKFISSAIEVNMPKRIDVGSAFKTDCLINGDILFQPILSEVVYKIDQNMNVIPFYRFENISQYKLVSQKDKNNFQTIHGKKNSFEEKESENYLLTWGEIQNLNNFTFFGFSGWNKRIYLYYSKQTSKTLLINVDNVIGNKSLKEVFLTYPKSVDGDKFYISPHPIIIENIKDNLPNGAIRTFFENTSFDSNPVLISFSIEFPESK